MNNPKISTSSINKLKQFLPGNYQVLIHKKINEAITLRQIRNIIAGTSNDYHGVIDAMIDIALEEKAKRKAIAKRMKIFSK
jgi:uncharacterized protein YeeX (DUF496 family)